MSIDDSDFYTATLPSGKQLWREKTCSISAMTEPLIETPQDYASALAIQCCRQHNRVYENWYYILLNFKLLESHMPLYLSALSDCVDYKLAFNGHTMAMLSRPRLSQVQHWEHQLWVQHGYQGRDKRETLWNINIGVLVVWSSKIWPLTIERHENHKFSWLLSGYTMRRRSSSQRQLITSNTPKRSWSWKT